MDYIYRGVYRMGKIVYRFSRLVSIASLIILIACNFIACHTNHYFSNEGVYYSSNPDIELNCPENSGTMTIDGVTYRLGLGFSNNGTKIYIENRDLYEQMPTDSNGDPIIDSGDVLLWQANTKIKNGKLYLTITKDNVSDYEGKTIVLEFRPNEG